jgi:glycosyltransferase involved in cell wall biosynthesis
MWTLRSFSRAHSGPCAAFGGAGGAVRPLRVSVGADGFNRRAEDGHPAFLAYGESTPRLFSGIPKAEVARRLAWLYGVAAVSGENAREIVADGYFPFPEKVKVFPNAVDPAKFHPMDRRAARAALNLPQEAFIVAFVGGFIERKGVGVLSQALNEAGASSIFIGRGDLAPTAKDMLFCGALDHDRIPEYLAARTSLRCHAERGLLQRHRGGAGDGLPVVSSDRPFNDGLLTEANSIRVDPTDPRAVADAIRRLMDDPALRARLTAGAEETGASLRIAARAAGILAFMEERL